MIFVTTGSAPFPRLISFVEQVAKELDEEFLVQIAGQETKTSLDSVDFLAMEEYRSIVENSRLVIGHAGIGTILTALEKETPIIVVPRRQKYGEHGDDHQVATADRFENKGLVAVARSEDELLSIIKSSQYPTTYSTENSLSDHIEQLIKKI